MKPYYQDRLVTIYHGDSRDVVPGITAEIVITDPPWGVAKASWDGAFVLPEIPQARVMLLMPGIVNLPRCPEAFGSMSYRWTLAAWVSNGMTRSPFGYGNWIAGMVYAAEGVRLHRQRSDFAKVAISGARPDHPSPKPIQAMRFFVESMPDGLICDPYAGSGSTLVAAKELGRQSIGIEIEERYCEEAARRCAATLL